MRSRREEAQLASRVRRRAALVAAPQIVRAQTLEKISPGRRPTDDMTSVYYAIKNGLYQKAGIDIEIVRHRAARSRRPPWWPGSYEMGKGSLIASLIAHLRGLPLVRGGERVDLGSEGSVQTWASSQRTRRQRPARISTARSARQLGSTISTNS